jgi:hypothetical protein
VKEGHEEFDEFLRFSVIVPRDVSRWPLFMPFSVRQLPCFRVSRCALRVGVIDRLWDDPEFEAEDRRRALDEAKRWDGEMLAGRYGKFVESLC